MGTLLFKIVIAILIGFFATAFVFNHINPWIAFLIPVICVFFIYKSTINFLQK